MRETKVEKESRWIAEGREREAARKTQARRQKTCAGCGGSGNIGYRGLYRERSDRVECPSCK